MTRKRYTPTLKAQVIQEVAPGALNAEKTWVQVAAEHAIHPTQLIKWRSTALEGLTSLFTRQESSVTLKAETSKSDYEARADMGRYLNFYNHENHKRPHQALGHWAPAQVYASISKAQAAFEQETSMASDEHEARGPLGQGTNAALSAPAAESAATAESEQVEQVRATEYARLHALVHGDLVAADQLHAEDFQLINPSGDVVSKEQYLSAIASEEIIYRVREPNSPIAVRLHDSVAVIRYRSRLDGIAGGQVVGLRHYWHTDVYERRQGQWQCVWSHATEIQ
jgi:transposase-like protein